MITSKEERAKFVFTFLSSKPSMKFMFISFRLWEDEGGRRWAKSAKDLQLEMLCVSQFTLYHVMKVSHSNLLGFSYIKYYETGKQA